MKKIENFNGQQEAIDDVLNRQTTLRKEVVVISGSPGTGITWTLEKIAEHWKLSDGVALQARGEIFAIERKLFPWLTLALPGTRDLARKEVLKGGVTQSTKSVPIVGPLASYLVEELINHKKKSITRENLLLTQQEQDILFVIQTSAANKRLLITIDNLDSWDDASWSILKLILSGKLDEFYPALKEVIILVGVTGEIPISLQSFNSLLPVTELKIHPLQRQEIPLAILKFGLSTMVQEDLDFLYEVSNGRLDLLHDIALHLREKNFTTISIGSENTYQKIIELRMRKLKNEHPDVEEFLSTAAILGQVFSIDDIKCLSEHPQEKIDYNLQLAIEEHLINPMDQMACFQSSVLHLHFHNARVYEHARYHWKFAQCLQIMRPAEYEYRLRHLKLAGKIDDALTCYALTALAAKRQQQIPPEPEAVKNSSDWPEVQSYLEIMFAAYDAYHRLNMTEAMQAIDKVEGFLPDVLLAERDYLEAQILLKSYKIVDFKKAVKILERWSNLKSQEADIWSRIAQILMVALIQINHIEEAQRIEQELTKYYYSRRKVDPWALYNLNMLRRRSECLHYLPTATTRLENALEYFGPKNVENLPRHPIQYYYTLNNLICNLLVSGRFNESFARAIELERLVHDHSNLSWPVLDTVVNNFILSSYLSGNMQLKAATVLMEKLLKDSSKEADDILLQNNYAVFLLFSDDPKQASRILEDTYKEIKECGEPDSYHLYFVGNNLAALYALDGEPEKAEYLQREYECGLNQFYPAIRQTIQKRHELLMPAFTQCPKLGVEGFNNYLQTNYNQQIGPQWKFYSRGFLFSDIQFWSAD